jgi:hypothetical protein
VVDEVIAAVASGDVDALESLVRYREVPCGGLKDLLGPPFPACEGAELETPVPAFAAGVCNAVWHRDPRPILERFAERSGALVAVIEGPRTSSEYEWWGYEGDRPTWDYRVIFEAAPAGEPVGYVVAIAEGRLDLLQLGCSSPEDGLLWWSDPPPAVAMRGPAFVEPPPASTSVPNPDPNLAPRGGHTGNLLYDRIIDAIASREAAQILTVLRAERMQCTFATAIGGPPRCENEQLEGTVVDAFLLAACEGAWTPADLPATAQTLASRDVDLYAIVGAEGSDQLILFAYASRDPSVVDTLLYVSNEGVVGYASLGCSEAEDFARWQPVIFRGTAWPAEDN